MAGGVPRKFVLNARWYAARAVAASMRLSAIGELCSPSRCCQYQRPHALATLPMLTVAPLRSRRTSAVLIDSGTIRSSLVMFGGSSRRRRTLRRRLRRMADITADQQVEKTPQRGLFHNWRYVLATTNPPRGHMDPVSKWLYLTRAGVLPMTLVAAAVAGLLAIYRDADVQWGWFALAAVGLVLSHMANNLMNDLFDLEVGTDRPDYPRNLYSPHPVLSGVISRKGLAACALVVNACCLAIMVVLTAAR